MLRRLFSYVGLLAIIAASLAPSWVLAQETEAPDTPSVAEAAQLGGALPGDPQVQLVQVADGLIDPIHVTSAYDGTGRVFVVERVGRIRIIENGTLLEEPFLDIQNQVKTDFLEQGLLGLAFHPDFETNGRFFIFFSQYNTNGAQTLAEMQVSADNPNLADPQSMNVLWQWPDPYVNHNGGALHFGPDGYLYLGVGDGGQAGDPYDNALDLSTPLGKIHRIDVDSGSPFGIPADNPFADAGQVLVGSQITEAGRYHPDGLPTIYAYGLRNPWSFQWDSATGDLYVADVGQAWWEEINVVPADEVLPEGVVAHNFGWDYLEGTHCYPADVAACDKWGTMPVAEYDHANGDCSILGLGVYRGADYPALDGVYFSGDYCSGRIFGLKQDDAGMWQFAQLLDTGLLLPGSGQDEAGNLYVTSCECAFGKSYDPYTMSNGAVWMLVDAASVPEGAVVAPGDDAEGEVGEAATPVDSADTALTEVTINSYDIYFDPKTVTIAANTDVVISLPNLGAIPHNFQITGTNISIDLAIGATETVTVNLPPGEYEFICNVAGHKQAGMVGTLTVQ